ncbi:MAG TPA: HAMP domain-containing sensor histidine kinase [Burkholderiaceae bacterium]
MTNIRRLFRSFETFYAFGRLSHLRYAGIVGAIGYPLFYLIYVYVLHQPYENLFIRLAATVGCIGLALYNHWPENARRYFLIYAYCVILYCLPLFHIFMALKNHGGLIMIADSFMAVFFLVLLTDWRNTLMMIFIALILAVSAYVLTTEDPSIPMDYVQRLPTFILVIVGGSLFKFSERQLAQKMELEKLHGMAAVLGTIAHEIRTPLGSISACARGLSRYVPILTEFYDTNKERILGSEGLPNAREAKKIEMTLPTIARIANECLYINAILDLLLANAIDKEQVQTIRHFDIETVVNRALTYFPFKDAAVQSRIGVEFIHNYKVAGNEDLCVMVLINLIKNGLTAISRGRKGAITITTDITVEGSRLIVRDTGCGIPKEQLRHIFKRFYSYPPNTGTGIGLAFCRDMLANWGAEIRCESEVQAFTQFIIIFPRETPEAAGEIKGDTKPMQPA